MASNGHPASLWRAHWHLHACLCLLPVPILHQPLGYGDLLPKNGDEDEADGEGLPPSQGNEPAVLYDLQSQIEWTLGNTLGILMPKSNGVDSEFAAVFHEEHEWFATLCSPVNGLQHGHFMKMFEADEVIMSSLSAVTVIYVFDPGGLSCLREEVLSDCQPASMTSHRHSTFVEVGQTKILQEELGFLPCAFWDVLLNVQCQFAETESYQPGFRPVDKSQLAGLSYGKANCRFHKNQCKVLLLMEIIQDDVVLYGCFLWLNERTRRNGAANSFLIPLRGSNRMQWNDEDFDEDVAAQKKKTKRRMMVLRLLYLMKDLLDPG